MDPDLHDLFNRLISQRMSDTQVTQNPMTGGNMYVMTPDRLNAAVLGYGPDYDVQNYQGFTPVSPNEQKPEAYVNKFSDPQVRMHEGMHQILGGIGDTIGTKFYKELDPWIDKAVKNRPEAGDYNEYPAYLFANPHELFDSPSTARAAQLKYLQLLQRVAPDTAKKLQGLVIQ